VVCLESDLQDGQMKEVDVGRHSVLLTRCEGKYSAIGNQCTHYGAPLSKGFFSGNKLRCPWHGSCFNVLTGDLEEFPGMDSLPCHKVKIENKKVYVSECVVFVCVCCLKDSTRLVFLHFVVFNSFLGAASLTCAETLRQENFGGRIIMVTREDLLPYDKTRLSKVMNVSSDTIMLRSMEFFHQYDIEVWLRKEALSVDMDKKMVTFDDGTVQNYDQLLLSTGCRAKGLDLPGMKLDNVKMLETPEDMLLEKDVRFHMIDSVTEIRGMNGKVKEVVLKSGKVIPTDVLIVGIGEYNSLNKVNEPVYVPLLQCMRTNVPDVFCAGDMAFFPLTIAKNQLVNIGHWQMAQAQGKIAALNMLNKATELTSIPFYWTVLLNKTIRYAGYGEGYTEIVMKGQFQFEERKFLALYIKDDEVIAAVGLNYDPVVSAVAERLLSGKVITKEEAQSDDPSWLQVS
uniref:Apoptosis inducing factor mitochondria associated 5 n=1 Tax=Nothobranchius furzeri TaxID=105023 RepID=A0A8C6L3J5_NOTFU